MTCTSLEDSSEQLKNEHPPGRSNDGRCTKAWMRHEKQV